MLPALRSIVSLAHGHHLKIAVLTNQEAAAELAIKMGCDYLMGNIGDHLIPETLLSEIKGQKILVCPALNQQDNLYETLLQRKKFSTYDLGVSNPNYLGSFQDLMDLASAPLVDSPFLKAGLTNHITRLLQSDSIAKENLKEMADAGISLVAGSGAGALGTMHASSYFDELESMKSDGLSNWQVLQAATLHPALLWGAHPRFGNLKTGNLANMILLDSSPVTRLENLQKVDWIMSRGKQVFPDTLLNETPSDLVQQQVNGYNYGDLKAFMAPYSNDVRLYQFPNVLLSRGKQAISARMAAQFKEYPHLHCRITQRIIQGNYVIDKETISGMRGMPTSGTAVYQIIHHKIDKVFLMM